MIINLHYNEQNKKINILLIVTIFCTPFQINYLNIKTEYI